MHEQFIEPTKEYADIIIPNNKYNTVAVEIVKSIINEKNNAVIMAFKDLKQKKWFKIMTNMYVLVLTVFVVWMLFFDTNSLLIHLELRKEIKKLEKTQEFLKEEIAKDKKIIEKLSDEDELERFAREEYYLKKKNEEIYLIEYEDSLKLKDKK